MSIKKKIIGFDFFTTKGSSEMLVKIKSMTNIAGLESNDIVGGLDVKLRGISAGQYRDLLDGKSYLEFWVEAIDHTKPTANNRLYGEEEFKLGMDRYLHKILRNGGLQPGEFEHPDITFDPKYSDEENFKLIQARLLRVEPSNITHYVADTKTEGGKTYFLIRTNPSNPVIVRDISLGKVPTFSIRTVGEFPLVDGVNVGKNLIVMGNDYVHSPAYDRSRPVASSLKFIDPANATEVKIELVPKVGNESIDIFNLLPGEKLVVGFESNQLIMNVYSKEEAPMTFEKLSTDLFSSIF